MPQIPKSIRSVNQILQGANHTLQSLMAQTQKILAVEALVRPLVPDGVRVGSIDEGSLTLIAPNSAIATRIRYRQRDIISSLRAGNGLDAAGVPEVNSLRILVRPDMADP